MKQLALIFLLASAAGAADTHCYTRGSRTYCDDGTKYYQYGKTIIRKDSSGGQERYRRFGTHTYGDSGSWIAEHPSGKSTGSYEGRPTLDAVIVPEIDGEDGDE